MQPTEFENHSSDTPTRKTPQQRSLFVGTTILLIVGLLPVSWFAYHQYRESDRYRQENRELTQQVQTLEARLQALDRERDNQQENLQENIDEVRTELAATEEKLNTVESQLEQEQTAAYIAPAGTSDLRLIASGVPEFYTDSLSFSNDTIVYQIQNKQISKLEIKLDDLAADANIEVYQILADGREDILEESKKGGDRDETLSVSLAPGTYFIRVWLVDGSTVTRYRLTLLREKQS